MSLISKLQLAKTALEKRINHWPSHAIFLGSGFHTLINELNIEIEISFSDLNIEVVSQQSQMNNGLYVGKIADQWCWIVGGRLHHYEGHAMEKIIFLIQLLGWGGTQNFFLTNASGSVDPKIHKGDLLLIEDHINWSIPSPLIGPNEEAIGPRYPMMLGAYDKTIHQSISNFCKNESIPLQSGIYLGLAGPQLETRAEYELFHRLGAHIVGMSTIPEVIAARHMGKSVAALSMVSNDTADMKLQRNFSMVDFMQSIENKKSDILKILSHWVTSGL